MKSENVFTANDGATAKTCPNLLTGAMPANESQVNGRSLRVASRTGMGLPNNKVYPSAGAFATSLVPTTPPPPARLSTMTGTPNDFAISSATTRADASTAPPAANGTTTRTVLLG